MVNAVFVIKEPNQPTTHVGPVSINADLVPHLQEIYIDGVTYQCRNKPILGYFPDSKTLLIYGFYRAFNSVPALPKELNTSWEKQIE